MELIIIIMKVCPSGSLLNIMIGQSELAGWLETVSQKAYNVFEHCSISPRGTYHLRLAFVS